MSSFIVLVFLVATACADVSELKLTSLPAVTTTTKTILGSVEPVTVQGTSELFETNVIGGASDLRSTGKLVRSGDEAITVTEKTVIASGFEGSNPNGLVKSIGLVPELIASTDGLEGSTELEGSGKLVSTSGLHTTAVKIGSNLLSESDTGIDTVKVLTKSVSPLIAELSPPLTKSKLKNTGNVLSSSGLVNTKVYPTLIGSGGLVNIGSRSSFSDSGNIARTSGLIGSTAPTLIDSRNGNILGLSEVASTSNVIPTGGITSTVPTLIKSSGLIENGIGNILSSNIGVGSTVPSLISSNNGLLGVRSNLIGTGSLIGTGGILTANAPRLIGSNGLLGSSRIIGSGNLIGTGASLLGTDNGLIGTAGSLIGTGSGLTNSIGSTSTGLLGTSGVGNTRFVGLDILDSVPQTVEFSKQFYSFSAPEEEEKESTVTQQLSNVLKKNLQVVFINAPENKAATNAALQLAKQAIEQRSAIYVLVKQHDADKFVAQVQAVQEHVPISPEVRFIKYRTPEDAAYAKQAIQSQYEKFGGTSEVFDLGEAPVLNYASNIPYTTGGTVLIKGASHGQLNSGISPVSSISKILTGSKLITPVGDSVVVATTPSSAYLPATPL